MTKDKLNTIYIISKGRPKCITAQTLKKIGYPGKWFIVCGNNDESIPEYKKNWGEDKVLIFDWYKESETSDLLDNFGVKNMSSGAVPVRNATRIIAEERGELRHWQFDDDYSGFYHIDRKLNKMKRINGHYFEEELFKIALFAHKAKLPNSGFALGMETRPSISNKFGRRVFNAHNMPTSELLFNKWRGRMNDDLINAMEVYHKGQMELSFKFMYLVLAPTQSDKGGNTDIYESEGTVRKTAYAILIEPKNTKLIIRFGRYHHLVNWKNICPRLIRESYAKK